jgi:Tol biopolymer transport system component
MRRFRPLSRGFRGTRSATALVSLGLAAAFIGGDARARDKGLAGRTVAPLPQKEALVAAIVVRQKLNGEGYLRAQPTLFTMREDGSKLQTVVAPGGSITRVASPAWSPDARRIYFVGVGREREGRVGDGTYRYYESDLYVVSASGGKPRRLTTTRDVGSVAPSPDGRRLLVTRSDHPGSFPLTSTLWLLTSDGRNAARVLGADEGWRDYGGSWSPDGRTIAFTRCEGLDISSLGLQRSTCGIYAVSPEGTGLRELARRSTDPAFSPNGRLIAFLSPRDENGKIITGSDERDFVNELYVMDADGGNQRRLTTSADIGKGEPSWSPDGLRLAYSSTGRAHFHRQLMLMNANGTCPKRLVGDADDTTTGADSFSSPAWRPGRFTGPRPPLTCKR